MPDLPPRTSAFQPIAPARATCKCCGEKAILYGITDFSKYCVIGQLAVPLSGIPIYYHRCLRCRFIFTVAFDDFTHQDFLEHIYNDDYAKIDPEYAGLRPRRNSQTVSEMFGKSRDLRILDYGGGNGLLASLLREAGFTNAACYDPFVPEFAARPSGPFDLIVCFEVFEHAAHPQKMLADIVSFLSATGGMIIFSTSLQPPEIETLGTGWWYIAPRNGHVSIYTKSALQFLGRPFGLKTGSFNENSHVLFNEIPEFAKHLFRD